MTEAVLMEELQQLVESLLDKITGGENGKPKVFRDSAVTSLTEFFNRFRQLNIGSNEQLDALVEEAQKIVNGVTPNALRKSVITRQEVAEGLVKVKQQLDTLVVDKPKPRRAIDLDEE